MSSAPRLHQFPSGLLEWRVESGRPIIRIHQTAHGAIWFGPEPGNTPVYRFDAPAGEFRTLYGAEELTGAFVETVLRRARRIIAKSFVEQRKWTVLAPHRDLLLAKVFDDGLLYHGVTADICAGDDYSASQRFAADLHSAFPAVDGIAYRARHNNGQICYALFDRCRSLITEAEGTEFKDHWAAVDDLMRRHGAVWDPATPVPPP